MEHHLSSTKPHLLFLTETQLFVTTDSSPFSVPSYLNYPHFRSKAGCCSYVRNDIICSRAQNLESSEIPTIWLRLQYHSFTNCVCAVYFSPNSSDYAKFFEYLNSKMEYILSHFPYAHCLVKLFRLCLSTSIYPLCWKFAHIQPVPKKGDRSNPSNYHPIALISCFSKAFEFVLNKKIMRQLSAHNLLSDCQYVSVKADLLVIFLLS